MGKVGKFVGKVGKFVGKVGKFVGKVGKFVGKVGNSWARSGNSWARSGNFGNSLTFRISKISEISKMARPSGQDVPQQKGGLFGNF